MCWGRWCSADYQLCPRSALSALLRRRWPRRVLCAAIVSALVAGCVLLCVIVPSVAYGTGLTADCSDADSRRYLDELCLAYGRGAAAGSLCQPLCSRRLTFRRCVGHGVKVHVLEAEWAGHTVILKAPALLESDAGLADLRLPAQGPALSRAHFMEWANMSVQDNFAGGRYSPAIADFLRQTFNECDVAGDGVLLHDEALLCLQLLRTAEYATLSLLRGGAASPSLLAASPALLGVCGLMYAVQYAPSAPFLGYRTPLADTRSWSFRSRLAVALLDMVERLEETALGTLYLCDMQEDNFGVVRGAGGRLVAKAIDVDIAWFGPALQQEVTSGAELSRPCSADGDCAFARCQVACNHTTGFCSGQLASSNLQTLCRFIFQRRAPWHAALLRSPPAALRQDLEALLHDCSHDPSPHLPRPLLKQLRTLLERRLD